MRFVLLPGQHHDSVGVRPLIEGVAFGALLGDKAFDADWLRAELDDRGAAAVIPPKVGFWLHRWLLVTGLQLVRRRVPP